MQRILAALVFLILASLPAHPQFLSRGVVIGAASPTFTPAWQVSKIGGGGNIIRLEVYPDGTMLSGTDVQIPYIWTGSGPWKRLLTTQTAPPFVPGSTPVIGTYAVAACAYDTNQSDTLRGSTSILYTVFNHIVYVSTNQGANWTNTGQAVAGADVNGEPNNAPYIWCDPASSGQVAYVGQLTGAPLKTTNGGTTWAAVSGITTPTANNGATIQGDPTSTVTSGVTQHVFISSAATGVYESYNGGSSFTLTSGSPTVIRQMSVDKFGIGWVLDNTNNELWKYVPNGTAGGGTWSVSVTNPGGQGVIAFAINPNAASEATESIVIASGFGGIVGSTANGGSSWTSGAIFTSTPPTSTDIPWLGVAGYIPPGVGANFIDLNFAAFDTSDNLFIALGVGVFKAPSPVVGNTFPAYVDQTAGIENMVSAQAISPPGLGPFNGFWDRGIFSNLNADVYPASQYTNAVIISGGWDITYAISTPSTLTQINASNIGSGDASAVSIDGGHSWTPWANFTFIVSGNVSFGGSVAATSPTDWIAVGQGGDLLCTTNGAASAWSTIAMPGGNPTGDWVVHIFNGGPSHFLAADKVTAGVYYAYASTVGLYSSVGGCAGTWTKVFTGSIGAINADSWAKLDSVPGHAGHLYYAPSAFATGGLFNSTNGGTTWNPVANLTDVSTFGFGATKPGADGYPTIYVDGFLSGVYGIWQGVNIDATPIWTNLSPGAWPGYDMQGEDNVVTGDINVYGRVTVCNHDSSCYYYDTADACPWVNFDSSVIYPTVSLTGTVNLTSKHSGLVPVTSVQYSIDGSNIGSPLTGAGPYTFAWATGGVATGVHTLKVTAAGTNCSGSFSIPITTH